MLHTRDVCTREIVNLVRVVENRTLIPASQFSLSKYNHHQQLLPNHIAPTTLSNTTTPPHPPTPPRFALATSSATVAKKVYRGHCHSELHVLSPGYRQIPTTKMLDPNIRHALLPRLPRLPRFCESPRKSSRVIAHHCVSLR